MHFDANGIVSVVELVVYIPAIVISFIVCARHGFSRTAGWLYTLILCLVRIVGAVCQLLSYTSSSTGIIEATIIVDSIGLSPLLLATLGLLSRFVDWINLKSPTPKFTVKHFRLLQLLITVGLILGIAGGTSGTTNPDGSVTPSSTSQAAVALYIVAWVGCVAILFISFPGISYVPGTERALATIVGVALPIILVRLVYSALIVFVHNSTFSLLNGSVGVRIGMATVEEFVVVALYLFLGFRLDKLEITTAGPILSRPWRKSKDNWISGSQRQHHQQRTQHRQRHHRDEGVEGYPIDERV